MNKNTTPAAAYLQTAPGKFAQLSHGSTHFQVFGAENAKNGKVPIVCVHGINAESTIWQHFAAYGAAHGRPLLALDLFGRGYSDGSGAHNDLALFVTQVQELLDSAVVKAIVDTHQIDLIGTSLGGGISAGKRGAVLSKFSPLA